MLNPNFDRLDVASTTYAKGEELPSEWSKTTLRVNVDPELHYYAIDQKKFVESNTSKYDGPSKNSRIDEDKQVWVQAHRWIEHAKFRDTEQDVGEWTVADRYAATRGEYIGRTLRVQLPVWRVENEEFVIADDLTAKGRLGFKGIPVVFGYGATGTSQPEAIAVDLNNGKAGIDKVLSRTEEGAVDKTTKVSDEAAPEVLLMDPSGRMLLLEGAIDAADKAREDRLELVHKRVAEVIKGNKGGDSGTTGTPFGK